MGGPVDAPCNGSHLRTLGACSSSVSETAEKQEADMKPTGSGEHSSTVQKVNSALEHGSVSLANQSKTVL